jgi:hypothetical protein
MNVSLSTFVLGIATLGATLAGASQPIPPDPPPRWWKGNLHTHTFWSDGNDFPEMVGEWYRNHGYHFLALSDHNVMSEGERWIALEKVSERSSGDAFTKYLERFGESWVETRQNPEDGSEEVRLKPFSEYTTLVNERDRFLMISGEEITDKARNGHRIHMNATNLGEHIEPPSGADVAETIRRSHALVREQEERLGREILFHVNHLNYHWGVTAEDLAEVVENRFFEVWNGVETDQDPGDEHHPSTDLIWDVANTLRLTVFAAPPLYGLATDDSHDYHGHSELAKPGRAWIVVKARHLSPESIIRGIEAGDFYSSTGVTLESIEFDGSTLQLQIEGVPGVTYRTRFIGSRRGVSVEGQPRIDASGNPLHTTLEYAPGIGETFATVAGLAPSYTLAGDELYVRAVVESDAIPSVPSAEYPFQRAWTQPVGWSLEAESEASDAE